MFDYLMSHDGPVVDGLEQFETVYAKDQPQYIPLPANVCAPYVETLWHLTLLERLTILLTGRVHLTIKTFGQPLQPLRLAVTRDEKI